MVKLSYLLLTLLFSLLLLYSYQQQSENDDFWNSVKTVDAPPIPEEFDQPEKSTKTYFGDDNDDENKNNIEGQTSSTATPPSEDVNKAKPFSFINLPNQDHYYYEIAAAIFLLIYSLLYFYGRIQNERIVDAWFVISLLSTFIYLSIYLYIYACVFIYFSLQFFDSYLFIYLGQKHILLYLLNNLHLRQRIKNLSMSNSKVMRLPQL